MKSYSKLYIVIPLLALSFLWITSCESDDLCDQKVNTPQLVIRFRDMSTQKEKKVSNLIVYGEGKNTLLINASTDSIALPLKVAEPKTSYVMVSNANYNNTTGEITGGDMTTITFTYQVQEEFVSRACGFKATYNTVSATIENLDDTWIQSINVTKTEVENEKNAHIQLYH
ncbi:DUF6452 family protein [Capnocytophaga canis]|uniref:DUF6452 family protein n=1 Tax=Capnocytophaga canis TaxID=1848903 RepID=UPI001562772E|nr:DUF6452 family protein [Capnocytophaga canis]